jgi:hypothetical protein
MYVVPGLVRTSVKPVCLPRLPGIAAAVGYFARSAVSRVPRSSGFRPNGRHLRSFSAAREEPRPGQEERFLAVVPGLRPCYDLNSVSIRVPRRRPGGEIPVIITLEWSTLSKWLVLSVGDGGKPSFPPPPALSTSRSQAA